MDVVTLDVGGKEVLEVKKRGIGVLLDFGDSFLRDFKAFLFRDDVEVGGRTGGYDGRVSIEVSRYSL